MRLLVVLFLCVLLKIVLTKHTDEHINALEHKKSNGKFYLQFAGCAIGCPACSNDYCMSLEIRFDTGMSHIQEIAYIVLRHTSTLHN